MINRPLDRIKRLSLEVLNRHQHMFNTDFSNNKTILDQITIIRSKGLRNEIAGYITRLIKKQQRIEKTKQEQEKKHLEAKESEATLAPEPAENDAPSIENPPETPSNENTNAVEVSPEAEQS